jgi:hypothetical protein
VGNIFAPNYRNGITEGIYILIFPEILKNEIDYRKRIGVGGTHSRAIKGR